MDKVIAFKTLGCRLNQYETDALAAQFKEAGYRVQESEAGADAVILNTCTVTTKADRKTRSTLNHSLASGAPVVVVTGCFAESAKEELSAQGQITFLVDNSRKSSIFHLLDAHFQGELTTPSALKPDLFGFTSAKSPFHTRGLVKIQDGCDSFCTYCIIPSVRGPGTSRAPEEVLQEAKTLLASGVKELVLTGVNISRYRHQNTTFPGLLKQLLDLEGDHRVRIASLEPEGLGQEFLDLIPHPRLAPHLHLCLQSGSDWILKLMARSYQTAEYLHLVEEIRRRRPEINFTTDVILGFPAESEADFQATLDVCRQVGFGQVHCFKFSPRQGTPAVDLKPWVSEAEKTRRVHRAAEVFLDLQKQKAQSLVGTLQRVLLEKVPPGHPSAGTSGPFFPVVLPGTHFPPDTWVQARITGIEETSAGWRLIGAVQS